MYFLTMIENLFQILRLIIIFKIELVRISYFSIRNLGDSKHFHIFQRIRDNRLRNGGSHTWLFFL